MANHPGQGFLESGKLQDMQYQALQECVNALGNQYEGATNKDPFWFTKMSNHEVAVYLEYNRRNCAQRDTIIYEGAMREYLLPEVINRLCDGVDMPTYVRRLLSAPAV